MQALDLFVVALLLSCVGVVLGTDIHIGGIFNVWNEDTTLRRDGQEALAAFLLAIEEINDKTDGIYDNILQGYELKPAIGWDATDYVGAVKVAFDLDALKPNPPVAIISSLTDATAIAVTNVLESVKAVHIITHATSAELSKGVDYPYKIRLCQCESFFGYVLQRALWDYFHYKRIAIFSTVEYFSTQSLHALTSFGSDTDTSKHHFQILYETILEPGEDFTTQILDAKATGALVFVLLTDPETTASLLVDGKRLGLFPEGSSIFCHSQSASSKTIANLQALDPDHDPDYYFAGFMSFQPAPNYGLQVTDFGKSFASRFKTHPRTYNSTNPAFCDAKRDYRQRQIFTRSSYPCGGLDFTEYASGAKTMDDYTGYVFDAVWALAFALHDILITQGISKSNFDANSGELLMRSFMDVHFVGATDEVSFSQGLRVHGKVTSQKLNYGDRETGFTYLPVNYNPAADEIGNWAPVGRWDAKGDWQLCDEYLTSSSYGPLVPCSYKVVYNTADGKRPRDRHPDVILRMPEALNGLFIALGSLFILMLLAASVYFYIHRDTQLIKSSQPPMMAMVLTGEALLSVRIILSSIVNLDTKGSDWLCVSHLWFGHLGVCMVFGGLFLKMWRVDKIINTKSLKRVKISNNFILLMGCAATGAICVYLAIVTGFGKPSVHMNISTVKNVDIYSYGCSEQVPEFEEALNGVEALFVLWGIKLTNATKNAPSAVNESVFIALATAVIIVLTAVGLPMAYLIGLSPVNTEILSTFLFICGVFSTSFILFAPKILDLYNEVGVSRLKLHDVKNRVFGSKSGAVIGAAQSWLGGGVTSQTTAASMSEAFSRAERKLIDACSAALHGFSLDERFMMCQRQLEYWRTMLVAVEEKRSSDTGSGSGGSSVATSSVFKKDSSVEGTESETELVSQVATFRPKPRRGSRSELSSVMVATEEEEENEWKQTEETSGSKTEEGV